MGRIETKFKQTEVGLIPENWEVRKLEELIKIIIPRKKIPLSQYLPIGSIPVIDQSKSMISGYTNDLQALIKNNLPLIIFGDHTCIIKITFFQFAQGADGVKVFYGKEEIITHYLYYSLLLSPIKIEDYKRHFLKLKNKNVLFPPTKTEQTAIANALSDADLYIESLEKLIDKKQKIKQGSLQQLLKPKPHWRLVRIKKIGNTYGGISGKSKSDFVNGNFPYIPFMNIMKNVVIDTSFISYVKMGIDENQNKALKGDLFFNGSSETPEELGMCSVLMENISNLYLNSFCFGFRLNQDCKENSLYLSYFFRSDEGRKIFYSMAQGATRYNLSKEGFKKIEILAPDPSEQITIAKTLSDIDSEIATLNQKLTKAKAIKQGMMQQLLTGKIRLI
jgi:type I restriction enzyme S subunit